MKFDEEKILAIAEKSKELGVELFVLDDGWFGHRDDATTSLGDWFPYLDKIPHGISGLAQKVTSMGIRFGLWIEPEMISTDSELSGNIPTGGWRSRAASPAREETSMCWISLVPRSWMRSEICWRSFYLSRRSLILSGT